MRASRGDLHINRAGIQSDNLLNDVLWWGGENRTIQWLSGVNVADLYKTIKKTIIKLPLGRYPWILFLCFVFFYFDTFSNPGEKSPQLPANPAVFFKFNKLACGDFPKNAQKESKNPQKNSIWGLTNCRNGCILKKSPAGHARDTGTTGCSAVW